MPPVFQLVQNEASYLGMIPQTGCPFSVRLADTRGMTFSVAKKPPFIAAIHRFQGLFETWLSRRCAFKRLVAAKINAQINVAVRTEKITRAGLIQTGIMS